jgi:hypothetical protein
MKKWEFVDLGELRLRSHSEKVAMEEDTQKVVVLPGFEVSQARQKLVWAICFVRYVQP